jgi:hypothetical protein
MLRYLIRGGCTLIAASAMLALPVAAAAARPAHFDPPKRYYTPTAAGSGPTPQERIEAVRERPGPRGLDVEGQLPDQRDPARPAAAITRRSS